MSHRSNYNIFFPSALIIFCVWIDGIDIFVNDKDRFMIPNHPQLPVILQILSEPNFPPKEVRFLHFPFCPALSSDETDPDRTYICISSTLEEL